MKERVVLYGIPGLPCVLHADSEFERFTTGWTRPRVGITTCVLPELEHSILEARDLILGYELTYVIYRVCEQPTDDVAGFKLERPFIEGSHNLATFDID